MVRLEGQGKTAVLLGRMELVPGLLINEISALLVIVNGLHLLK